MQVSHQSLYIFCLENILVSIDDVNNWTSHPTFNSKLWIKIIVDNTEVSECLLEVDKYYVLERDNKKYLIYLKKNELSGVLAFKYSADFDITIGNTETDSIIYRCPYFSNSKVQLKVENNQINIINSGNNLVYINKYFKSYLQNVINFGDELDILGLKILFLKDLFIIINHQNIKTYQSHFLYISYIQLDFQF